LINASIGLNYQAFENFGIGLNYNVFDLDVDVKKNNWRGNANISYDGPYAFLSFYWEGSLLDNFACVRHHPVCHRGRRAL
jgi:hypothetical protein